MKNWEMILLLDSTRYKSGWQRKEWMKHKFACSKENTTRRALCHSEHRQEKDLFGNNKVKGE